MGGPLLYPGDLMNTYTGGADGGFAASWSGLTPEWHASACNWAAVNGSNCRPWPPGQTSGCRSSPPCSRRSAGLVSVTGLDAGGEVLEPQDLSGHEAAWRRFLRGHGSEEA